MRILFALAFCLFAAAAAASDEIFPYTATINGNDVYVRSGPGKDYYPTDKLTRGHQVEIWRHDPGGWCAIRPPEGSFTWVEAKHVKVVEEDVAEVTEPGTTAYVGSRFSEVHDVRQVQLDRGEKVRIVGEKRFADKVGGAAQTWYKIEPPAGEFRWIYGKFIRRQGIEAVADASRSKSWKQSDEQRRVRLTSHGGGNESSSKSAAGKTAQDDTDDGPGEGAADREIVAINVDLSRTVAEEPGTWELDDLEARTNKIVETADSALVRGRARAILREIERYRTIQEQHVASENLREKTDLNNQRVAAAAIPAPTAAGRKAHDYDGVGRLTPVRSRMLGAPQYALTDQQGSVLMFVSPAADVNMNGYVGQVVGVSGVRGFMPRLKKPHVTAKRIQPVQTAAMPGQLPRRY